MVRKRSTPILTGSTGLVRYGGEISRVEDEWHPALRGPIAARVYREMGDNDATLGSSYNLMTFTLRQVPWMAKEADGSDESKQAAENLESMFADMEQSWGMFVGESLSKIKFGFAPFEIGYKQRLGPNNDKRFSSKFSDGLVGWRGFFIRSQETVEGWRFDDEGNVLGMYQVIQYPVWRRVFIPIEKLLLFRTEANKGNPEGRSWFRNAYRSWFFLKRLQEMEAIGIERELNGLPVVRLPEDMCSADAPAKMKTARANYDKLTMQIRRNTHEGITFPASMDRNGKPTGYDIGLLSTNGTRAIDVGEAIRRYENRIAMVFGAQFQLLGSEKTGGNRALSGDMTDMFGLMMGSVLDEMQEELAHEVDRIQEFNGVPKEKRATWEHGDIEKVQVDKLATALKALSDGGYIQPGDLELENFLRETLDVPLRSEDATTGDEAQLDEASADDALDDLTSQPDPTTAKSAPMFSPSEEMAITARAALKVRDRMPREKRAQGMVNLARARDIAARKAIPLAAVKRMGSFFAKHEKHTGPSWEKGGRNWQVFNGLGGEAGVAWVKACLKASKVRKVAKDDVCTECGAVLIEVTPGMPCPECGVEMALRTSMLPVPPANDIAPVKGVLIAR